MRRWRSQRRRQFAMKTVCFACYVLIKGLQSRPAETRHRHELKSDNCCLLDIKHKRCHAALVEKCGPPPHCGGMARLRGSPKVPQTTVSGYEMDRSGHPRIQGNFWKGKIRLRVPPFSVLVGRAGRADESVLSRPVCASCAVHAARQKSVGLQEVVSGFIANARHWPTSCESEAEN